MNKPSDEQLEYIRWLTNKILDEYNLEHGPTVFRHKNQSHCRIFPDKTFQVIFGYESCDRVFAYGFREYVRVANTQVNYALEAGMKGLHNLAIHEAAHAVSEKIRPPKNIRNQYHGETFVAAVELLHEEYRLVECWRQFQTKDAIRIAAHNK